MFEIFAYDFFWRAALAALILSVLAPSVGLFFVVRRQSTLSDTLAHISLAGAAIGLATGLPTMLTAFLSSLLSLFGIEWVRTRRILPPDTILPLFLSGGLAVGIIGLQSTTGSRASSLTYLFGNLLTLNNNDLWLLGVVATISLAFLIGWRTSFFSLSLDEDVAAIQRVPTTLLNNVLLVIGAATIAVSLQVVGVLLIGALMVIPVVTALELQRGFFSTWCISVIVSLASACVGLWISLVLDWPSGASMVLVLVAVFLSVSFGKRALGKVIHNVS